MGWDAFGLPAEQYAIKHNVHPRDTTRKNVDNFRRQIKSLGFSYDWDREVDTTDPAYYRWTQWIFLQLFDTWYDPDHEWVDPGPPRTGKGRPIAELPIPEGTADPAAYRDSKRLAYRAEVPVNWCPGLGTVLANEEVIDGKSERGGFPGRPDAAQASGCSGSPPTPTAWSRTSNSSTGPRRSATCSATGSAGAKGPRSTSSTTEDQLASLDRRSAKSGWPEKPPKPTSSASSPPGPTPSSARPTWSSRPSTRSSTP